MNVVIKSLVDALKMRQKTCKEVKSTSSLFSSTCLCSLLRESETISPPVRSDAGQSHPNWSITSTQEGRGEEEEEEEIHKLLTTQQASQPSDYAKTTRENKKLTRRTRCSCLSFLGPLLSLPLVCSFQSDWGWSPITVSSRGTNPGTVPPLLCSLHLFLLYVKSDKPHPLLCFSLHWPSGNLVI